ncbi:MAG TPA: hypothetical protein VJB02_04260 [Coxiellaceae bacterium]|nr:hypothetical protein [Coxiellaceae bacterium]
MASEVQNRRRAMIRAIEAFRQRHPSPSKDEEDQIHSGLTYLRMLSSLEDPPGLEEKADSPTTRAIRNPLNISPDIYQRHHGQQQCFFTYLSDNRQYSKRPDSVLGYFMRFSFGKRKLVATPFSLDAYVQPEVVFCERFQRIKRNSTLLQHESYLQLALVKLHEFEVYLGTISDTYGKKTQLKQFITRMRSCIYIYQTNQEIEIEKNFGKLSTVIETLKRHIKLNFRYYETVLMLHRHSEMARLIGDILSIVLGVFIIPLYRVATGRPWFFSSAPPQSKRMAERIEDDLNKAHHYAALTYGGGPS